jgi:polyhydroxybutyrate depolymerase
METTLKSWFGQTCARSLAMALCMTAACAEDARLGDDTTLNGGAALEEANAPARCTGKPGKLRGKRTGSVQIGLSRRNFVYYAPKDLDPNKPVPLLIVPHGFTMSGEAMYQGTAYEKIADREGFVVFYPDGNGTNPWNVGSGVNGWGAFVAGNGDDQRFVDEMIAYALQDQCIDEDHMFMSGFSMGGYFSNETGCLRSDIRAIGPHSGGSHDLSLCPGTKKPVILFHGDADPLIYYSVGQETRDRWVRRNGCSRQFDAVKVKGGTCEYYRDCKNGQVTLCHFDGMGHEWAGGRPGNLFFDTSHESAAELGWAFFKKYAW